MLLLLLLLLLRAMNSPENAAPAPAPAADASPTVVQESPFFTYVSSLSPINLAKDVHVPSAFRELNFPSPSPVFTSPHINPVRKENILRRSQNLASDSGKFSLGYNGGVKELSENTSHFGPDTSQSMGVLVPRIMDSEREIPGQVQSCSSPSGCVDDFFADAVEDCVYSSGPSGFCVDQTVGSCQSSLDKYGSPRKTSKECIQLQSCSTSASVNAHMTNQVEYGRATNSVGTLSACCPSQGVEIHNNSANEIIKTHGCHECSIKEGAVMVVEPSTSACEAEESPAVYVPFMHLICVQTKDAVDVANNDRMDDDRAFNQCSELTSQHAMKDDPTEVSTSHLHGCKHSEEPNIKSTISVIPYSGKDDSPDHRGEKSASPLEHSDDSNVYFAENSGGIEQDRTPQLLLESLQSGYLDHSQQENSLAECNSTAEQAIPYEQVCLPSKLQLEGYQHPRAMRKRLEFVSSGTPKMDIECSGRACNLGATVNTVVSTSTESPSGHLFLESLNASHAESIETSTMEVSCLASFSGYALSKQSLCLNQTTQAHFDRADISIRRNGSSSVTAPRPAGIGLHLNSIGNSVGVNCNTNMQLIEKDLGSDCLSAQGEMALCQSADQRINDSKGSMDSMNLTINVPDESALDSYSPLGCTSFEGNEENEGENLAMLLPHPSVSLPSPLNVNPLKISLKSKLLSHSLSRCNMKRCSSDDACRSEEKNEMSPKKKSKKASESDGCKRCNCKKSKCLKLYCDCFAAGVYCAEACACQGCLNRPEYEDTVLETRQQIENRNPLAFAPKVVVHIAEAPKTNGEDNEHATPASARHKRGCNCKRSQCLKKYCECFQSKVGCSLGCRCEGCKNTYGMRNGGFEVAETEHKKTKKVKYDNDLCDGTDSVEVRSERSNNDGKHLHLSPFTPLLEGSNGIHVSKSQFPARRYLSSPDSAASARSPFSPGNSVNEKFQAREENSEMAPSHGELYAHDEVGLGTFSPRWDGFANICDLSPLPISSSSDAKKPTKLLVQGSSRLSVHSLLWRTSPNTPTPRFGESKLATESCSDSGRLNVYEDDTPDILKDNHMPDKGPKISSPNKKRVSPPHKCLNEMPSSSSSPSMRSRKFILKSVPSFPSLTPYSNTMKGQGA